MLTWHLDLWGLVRSTHHSTVMSTIKTIHYSHPKHMNARQIQQHDEFNSTTNPTSWWIQKWLHNDGTLLPPISQWLCVVVMITCNPCHGGAHLAIGVHLHFLAHDLFYIEKTLDWLCPQSQINKILKRKVVFSPKGVENITSFLILIWMARTSSEANLQRTRTHSLFRLALTH